MDVYSFNVDKVGKQLSFLFEEVLRVKQRKKETTQAVFQRFCEAWESFTCYAAQCLGETCGEKLDAMGVQAFAGCLRRPLRRYILRYDPCSLKESYDLACTYEEMQIVKELIRVHASSVENVSHMQQKSSFDDVGTEQDGFGVSNAHTGDAAMDVNVLEIGHHSDISSYAAKGVAMSSSSYSSVDKYAGDEELLSFGLMYEDDDSSLVCEDVYAEKLCDDSPVHELGCIQMQSEVDRESQCSSMVDGSSHCLDDSSEYDSPWMTGMYAQNSEEGVAEFVSSNASIYSGDSSMGDGNTKGNDVGTEFDEEEEQVLEGFVCFVEHCQHVDNTQSIVDTVSSFKEYMQVDLEADAKEIIEGFLSRLADFEDGEVLSLCSMPVLDSLTGYIDYVAVDSPEQCGKRVTDVDPMLEEASQAMVLKSGDLNGQRKEQGLMDFMDRLWFGGGVSSPIFYN